MYNVIFDPKKKAFLLEKAPGFFNILMSPAP